jgi:hypothetical protein
MENCHHMAGGMSSMGDEQSHDCCDHSASMALHNADCDLNCEHCGSDLGNSNLAIMADIAAIATSPPPGINSQSPSIPSPPDTSEIIPPIG